MRRTLLLALVLALSAGAAQARGHGFHTFKAPRAHRASHPRAHGAAAREGGRHRHAGSEIKSLGPSTFHPVKRYKGFSYLQHEQHPAKDD
jgi:hypothetical protein